jgi:hypothetical protein
MFVRPSHKWRVSHRQISLQSSWGSRRIYSVQNVNLNVLLFWTFDQDSRDHGPLDLWIPFLKKKRSLNPIGCMHGFLNCFRTHCNNADFNFITDSKQLGAHDASLNILTGIYGMPWNELKLTYYSYRHRIRFKFIPSSLGHIPAGWT